MSSPRTDTLRLGNFFELNVGQFGRGHVPGIAGRGAGQTSGVASHFSSGPPVAGHHRRVLTGLAELVFGLGAFDFTGSEQYRHGKREYEEFFYVRKRVEREIVPVVRLKRNLC